MNVFKIYLIYIYSPIPSLYSKLNKRIKNYYILHTLDYYNCAKLNFSEICIKCTDFKQIVIEIEIDCLLN